MCWLIEDETQRYPFARRSVVEHEEDVGVEEDAQWITMIYANGDHPK